MRSRRREGTPSDKDRWLGRRRCGNGCGDCQYRQRSNSLYGELLIMPWQHHGTYGEEIVVTPHNVIYVTSGRRM
ncbi:hypothetical protein LINPERHAP1_LOCUS17059 [Linum perenne]